MKKLLPIFISALTLTPAVYAQEIEDDIYYDGRRAEKNEATRRQQAAQSPDLSNLPAGSYYVWQPSIELERDVDEYNRFGGYYESAIDTIGAGVADSEDFVYTQQIQRFYNPTIVTDNEDILADVLNNSYGNVNIIYNATGPAFSSWYYSPYFTAYTPWGGFYSPVNWGWYTGWLDPWYGISFGWGPYYGWNNWGWGWTTPGWGWGWNSPAWGRPPHHAWHGRPAGPAVGNHRPAVGVRPGWSQGARPGNNRPGVATRPGNNYRPGTSTGNRPAGNYRPNQNTRPGQNYRPGNTQTTRPGNNYLGGASENYSPGHSVQGGGVTNGNSSRGGYSTQQRGTSSRGSNSYQSSGSRNNSSGSRSNSGYRQSSGNSGRSSGSYRSSGGSGTRSSGGGMRGGGGGGRGGRR